MILRLTGSLTSILALSLTIGGCGNGANQAAIGSAAAPTTEPATTDTPNGDEIQIVTVEMPDLPPIGLPDISILGETGDVVGGKLGDLISPVSGVDLVAATCSAEGGDPTYRGTTGTDLFDIEHDGSGAYKDESENGLTTLVVEPDGSGEYYDRNGNGLVTIKVRSDGAGEYYSEQTDGLVTVKAAADGSGEYYDNRDDAVLTITLQGDGAGQYYRKDEGGLLTIDARSDGSGEYFRSSPGGVLVTLQVEPSGRWRLTDTSTSRLIELIVESDGSGTYVESGLNPLEFEFDAEGLSPGRELVLPSRPTFAVAGRFPSLGKLGSLAPPCAAVIRFEDQLLFETDESEVRAEAGEVLGQVVVALNEIGKPIEVSGHTDSVGSDEYNLDLSRRRAEAVAAALKQRGLTVDVTVEAFGETRPIAPNAHENGDDNPAGRSQNRRVEILIRE